MTPAEIIGGLLEREGGDYSDDPVDHGGPTRWGITMPVLAEFRRGPVTAAHVEALTREEAAEVYEHLYLIRSGYLHILDEQVRVMALDWAVNSGIACATKALQRLVGVEVDGVCGPVTIGAVNKTNGRELLKSLGRARQAFYVHIVQQSPDQIRFLQGWLARNWAVAVDPL